METDDEEEPVQRGSDHPEGAAGRAAGDGDLSTAWISDATFYTWRSRYGGTEVSDARWLKTLDDENRRLKKLLAEAMLDVSTLREVHGERP